MKTWSSSAVIKILRVFLPAWTQNPLTGAEQFFSFPFHPTRRSLNVPELHWFHTPCISLAALPYDMIYNSIFAVSIVVIYLHYIVQPSPLFVYHDDSSSGDWVNFVM